MCQLLREFFRQDVDDPFVPLVGERQAGETQLFVKQVKVEDKRYIMPQRGGGPERPQGREAIAAALDAPLKKGDKALAGNSALQG